MRNREVVLELVLIIKRKVQRVQQIATAKQEVSLIIMCF